MGDVRFTRVHDFDISAEQGVFDLLDVTRAHGWLVDPQDSATCGVLGARSHSQVLARVAELEAVATPGALAEAALLTSFLKSAPGGMSPHGLATLVATLPDRQLCVLHRAGAHHAAFTREGNLYLLLADAQGAGMHATAVWERVDSVRTFEQRVENSTGAHFSFIQVGGPTTLVSGTFQPVLGPGGGALCRSLPPPPTLPLPGSTDTAPAVGLSSSGSGAATPSPSPLPPFVSPSPPPFSSTPRAPVGDTAPPGDAAEERDHALAVRLQEAYEEQERAARRAVRSAAARLQQQLEKGAGSSDAREVRDFLNRVEEGGACSVQ